MQRESLLMFGQKTGNRVKRDRREAMPKAALYVVCAGLLGLIALPSSSAAKGTSSAPPQCPPARQEQGSPAQIGGLWRAELPWLAMGMSREQVVRVSQPCGHVERAGQPTLAVRQSAEGPEGIPNTGHTPQQ